MIIRRAQQSDAAALTDCLTAAYAPFVHLDLPPVASGVADDIAGHGVWVAEVDGAVKGGVVLALADAAHIANLAVHPDAGGHGMGAALIDQAKAHAVAAGYREIALATHVEMTATQSFYRKRGWHETGRDGNKVYFRQDLN